MMSLTMLMKGMFNSWLTLYLERDKRLVEWLDTFLNFKYLNSHYDITVKAIFPPVCFI